MKKINVSIFVLAIFLLIDNKGMAQQPPTGTPPANNTNAQAGAGWYRGGNTTANGTKLNGVLSNNYFGYFHDVTGHFGIGRFSPLTMLHVEGLDNTPFRWPIPVLDAYGNVSKRKF